MAVCFIDESSVLLRHDATSVSNSMQTFRGNVMPSYIVGDRSFLGVSRTFILLTRVPQVLEVCGPLFNLLTPNEDYSGRTAPLTSERCILYIYSTNIGTEYFKHGIYSPVFPLQNAVCFIILTYLVPGLITFYIQNVLKLKKIIPAPKG